MCMNRLPRNCHFSSESRHQSSFFKALFEVVNDVEKRADSRKENSICTPCTALRQCGREGDMGRELPWLELEIWHLSKGSKLMLVVLSKQALNEPGHEEPIPWLISEITQISVNAHLAHHSESYCPRQVPELCEERGEGAERIFLLREAERIGWKKDRVKQVYLILETWRGKSDAKIRTSVESFIQLLITGSDRDWLSRETKSIAGNAEKASRSKRYITTVFSTPADQRYRSTITPCLSDGAWFIVKEPPEFFQNT